MLQKLWTAATLSIGQLPFLIGVPVVFTALGTDALSAEFDRRVSA